MKKKTVTLREFQHHLSKLSEQLKPGESLLVTKHGQTLGTFTKAPKPRKSPDFLANLAKFNYPVEAGQKLIDDICGVS